METILKLKEIVKMKFITMWKDYNNMVLKPAWKWVKTYWKEYGLFTIILGVGAGLYFKWAFLREMN